MGGASWVTTTRLLFVLALALIGLAAVAGRADAATASAPRWYVPARLTLELPTFRAGTSLPLLAGFTSQATAAGTVHVEATAATSPAEVLALLAAAREDIAATTGMALDARPTVYVFGGAASFAAALRSEFAHLGSEASAIAAAHAGVFDPVDGVVLVNLRKAGGTAGLAALLRHELTHAAVARRAARVPDLPAWFDEGLAVLAERRPGSERQRCVALSAVVGGAAGLGDLATRAAFLAASATGDHAYAVAGAAAAALRDAHGLGVFAELLDGARAVGSFDEAFERVTGTDLHAFERGFGRTAGAIVDAASGRWCVHGVAAGAEVRVRATGPGLDVDHAVRTDASGLYWGSLPSESGGISVTAQGRGLTVTLAR